MTTFDAFFGKSRPKLVDGRDLLETIALDPMRPIVGTCGIHLPQPQPIAPGGTIVDPMPDHEQVKRWLAKANRRRKKLARAHRYYRREAQRLSRELIDQTTKSVQLYEKVKKMEVEALTMQGGIMRTAVDMMNLRRTITSLVNRVFELGVHAGRYEGQEDKLAACREEMARLVIQSYLLVECCYICGNDKGLREFLFLDRMAIWIEPAQGGGLGYRVNGDNKSHALCEVCHAKLMLKP